MHTIIKLVPATPFNGAHVLEKETSSHALDKLPKVRNTYQRLLDARNQPYIKQLLSVIWQTGELHLLFADTGVGKSIYSVAVADALSKGHNFMVLENENFPLTVLYYDFELSDRQFHKRYSNEHNQEHSFSDFFYIDTIDFAALSNLASKARFEEILFEKIKYDINSVKAQVLIIDNLTFLNTHSTQDTQIALEVMRKLNELKKEYNLSILVLAHTPKRSLSSPITINDLAGSKHLSNFADSISTIGKSTQGKQMRYIKQIKPRRSSEMVYDTENVIICEIAKIETMLTFEFVGFSSEKEHLLHESDELSNKKALVVSHHEQGKSIREIANEVEIGKSTVQRWLSQGRTL